MRRCLDDVLMPFIDVLSPPSLSCAAGFLVLLFYLLFTAPDKIFRTVQIQSRRFKAVPRLSLSLFRYSPLKR